MRVQKKAAVKLIIINTHFCLQNLSDKIIAMEKKENSFTDFSKLRVGKETAI
jgi:hypothetical protein